MTRSHTLIFCLPIFYACVTLVSGNPSLEDCKAQVLEFYANIDPVTPKSFFVDSIGQNYNLNVHLQYFLHSLINHNKLVLDKQPYTERNILAENYYAALYESVSKQIKELVLPSPKQFCKIKTSGAVFTLPINGGIEFKLGSYDYSDITSYMNAYNDCLNDILKLNICEINDQKYLSEISGIDGFFNMYFFQNLDRFENKDKKTEILGTLESYMMYFHDIMIVSLANNNQLLTVETYCAKPKDSKPLGSYRNSCISL